MTTKHRSGAQLYRKFSGTKVHGQIIAGESVTFLHSLDDACADIVFLDPPFNLGKEYKHGQSSLDKRPEISYRTWLFRVLFEGMRVLKPGGALYLYHLPFWAMQLGSFLTSDGGLTFQHWIAISMKNGFVRGDHLYPAHYALLMYTKGEPTTFHRPKLTPAKCRHCKKLVKDYGGYKAIIEKKGLNLSDFWEDLSPVRHANRKHRSANELPPTLFDRVLEISGIAGGLYVDPFAGAGSGVISAVNAGMRFAGCDLFPQNCAIICQRLDEVQSSKKG